MRRRVLVRRNVSRREAGDKADELNRAPAIATSVRMGADGLDDATIGRILTGTRRIALVGVCGQTVASLKQV